MTLPSRHLIQQVGHNARMAALRAQIGRGPASRVTALESFFARLLRGPKPALMQLRSYLRQFAAPGESD